MLEYANEKMAELTKENERLEQELQEESFKYQAIKDYFKLYKFRKAIRR